MRMNQLPFQGKIFNDSMRVYDAGGKLRRLTHEFYPPIYVGGGKEELKRFSSDLWGRSLITGGRWASLREFWN